MKVLTQPRILHGPARWKWATIFFILSTAITSVGADDVAGTSLLVDHRWLVNHLDDSDLRILDFRKSALAYRLGHIPGARRIPRRAAYDTVDSVKGMFPGPAILAEYLGSAGVLPEHRIVIYDGSDSLWAARLFWALEVIGHDDVRILDGGYRAWKEESGSVTRKVTDLPPVHYTPEMRPRLVADTQWMLDHLGSPGVSIIDSRSPEEFSGEDRQATRGGHMPGAVNIDWVNYLVAGDGSLFLTPDSLKKLYRQNSVDGKSTIVAHCQTGVRASHTYFALRMLGYADVRVYDGSWEVWGNRSDTPIITAGR